MPVNKAAAANSLDIYTFLTVSHFQMEGREKEKVIQNGFIVMHPFVAFTNHAIPECVCVCV